MDIARARDSSKGKSAAYQLYEKEGLGVMFYQLDVLNQKSMDVLVNNAAILYDIWQNAVNADLEVINEGLRTNLFGPWRLSQAFVPMMRANKY